MKSISTGRGSRGCAGQGFTLIELMVVVALIGILAAVIIPEMKGTYEEALLRSTSRDLVNVFQLTYSRAVSHNQIHRVRLQESSGRYLVEARSGNSSRWNDFAPVMDLSGAQGKLDSRISVRIHRRMENSAEPGAAENSGRFESPVQAAEDVISFYPDGTADGSDVELQDRQGFRLVLRVNPVTARVHIMEVARP